MNQPVTLWTGPRRATRMMQATALAKCSGRSVLVHPGSKGVVGPGPGDPWTRLDQILSRPDFKLWPTTGWILVMELTCPHCGETRMIEVQQSHRGQILVCSMCGKDAPIAKPADLPRP